jgi:hypothetical protein
MTIYLHQRGRSTGTDTSGGRGLLRRRRAGAMPSVRRARAGESLHGAFQLVADHIGDVDGPRMRRRPARIRDDRLPQRVGVPGFHRGSLVRGREGSEDCVAVPDLRKIALDDLRLPALGLTPVVASHRVDRFPADPPDEHDRTPAVLVSVRGASEVHPPHGITPVAEAMCVMGLE